MPSVRSDPAPLPSALHRLSAKSRPASTSWVMKVETRFSRCGFGAEQVASTRKPAGIKAASRPPHGADHPFRRRGDRRGWFHSWSFRSRRSPHHPFSQTMTLRLSVSTLDSCSPAPASTSPLRGEPLRRETARALAIVVTSPELMNVRCTSLEEMRLVTCFATWWTTPKVGRGRSSSGGLVASGSLPLYNATTKPSF